MSLASLTKASETELRRFYVAACTERFADVRLFIRNVGRVELDGRTFKAGIAGQADCYGFLFREPYPMPLEIELKNVKTKHTDEQKAWQAYCVSKKVPYLLLRAANGETPEQVIHRWVRVTDGWLKGLRNG